MARSREDACTARGDGYISNRIGIVRHSSAADRRTDLLRDFDRTGSGRIGENDRKLLTPDPGDKIARTGDHVQRGCRNLLQTLVAARMPVRVVIGLEPVHVDDEQRQRKLFAHATPPF